ncbi:50S ribosomal protein L10 [Deferribacterales bacterium RsTz2092]|nr:50S ribosomal protein L10 [Deferribacterales bacterium]
MKKQEKIEISKGVVEEISGAEGIVLASYKGMSFPQMDVVRRAIKGGGNDFRVVKNTLLRKALNSSKIDSLDEFLVESTVLVVVRKDFAATAKTLKKFSGDFPFLAVKAGIMDGVFLSGKEVLRIADLPSREQLLAQLFATMEAPYQNFVSLLANIPRSFLNVLNAIKGKK